jgi:hypothetical protein
MSLFSTTLPHDVQHSQLTPVAAYQLDGPLLRPERIPNKAGKPETSEEVSELCE